MEKANVITLTYDLLLYSVPQLVKFPRHQKFVLADRIQNLLTDVLQQLVSAYFSRTDAKKSILVKVNLDLEMLRYLFRLAKDLRCIDLRRYELVEGKINEIGVQVGAWIKSLP
jgi:hypothetical protein